MSADHYTLLGVPRDATTQDIKRAFRRIARECHPDIAGEDPERVKRFHAARRAYEILMDPVTRARYDRRGQRLRPNGESFFDAFYRRTGEVRAEKFRPNERSGQRIRGGPGRNDMSLDDLLDGFGGGRSRPEAPEPRRGPSPSPQAGGDIEIELEVPAAIARSGGSVTATYFRMRRSDHWTPGDLDPGLVRVEDLCGVRILPGTPDGTVLREHGMGDAGPWGGPAGDLVVRVKIVGDVEPSPEVPDTSEDLRVEISVVQALIGGRVQVDTPQGPVVITVPPGTSSHTRMRVRAKGRLDPNTGDPVDLFLVFRICVPEALDAEARRLVEQLAERLED